MTPADLPGRSPPTEPSSSAPKPLDARRARRVFVEEQLVAGKSDGQVIAEAALRFSVSATTARLDVRRVWRRWRRDGSRRIEKRRDRVLARLERETDAAFAAGERHAGMRGLALQAKVLGMVGPESLVQVGIHTTTIHASLPLPIAAARAREFLATIEAQFGADLAAATLPAVAGAPPPGETAPGGAGGSDPVAVPPVS